MNRDSSLNGRLCSHRKEYSNRIGKSSENSQSIIEGSRQVDLSNKPALQSQDRLQQDKKTEGHAVELPSSVNSTFDFQELGVREDELGSYLFDYFEQVDERFKVSFYSGTATIRNAMQGFLTYHYFNLVRVESKQKAGLVCFGCKNPTTIHIVHLSVIDSKDFIDAIADIRAIIWKEFPLVNSISILVKYLRSTSAQKKTMYHGMDSFITSAVRSVGFTRTFLQEDTTGRNRISGFTTRRTGYTITMDPVSGRLVMPKLEFDSKATNLRVHLTLLVANQSITPDKRPIVKDLVQTELGPGIPMDYLVDLRAPVTLLLAYYAILYSKWTKASFTLPGYGVTVKDLLACKSKISSLKVSITDPE